jgi:hypothetical protein
MGIIKDLIKLKLKGLDPSQYNLFTLAFFHG